MKPSTHHYNSIDITKFIMAFLVVAIHTGPFIAYIGTTPYNIYDCMSRCAVPFFFMASGYLVAQKAHSDFTNPSFWFVVRKHLQKMLKLYLIWTAIYAPLTIIDLIRTASSPIHGIYLFLRGFLFVGENYNSWMLWYLLSAVYSLGFMLIMNKLRFQFIHIFLCGATLYVIGILVTKLGGYQGELPWPITVIRYIISHTIINGRIFGGFLYIPLGMYLAKYTPSRISGFCMFLAGLVTYILLDGLLDEIALVICSIGFFTIIIHITLNDSPIYRFFRTSSTVIYFIHMYVWTIYYTLVYQQKSTGMDSFLSTALISLIISLIYFFVKNIRHSP